MKIILIGAGGDIGSAAHAELSSRHELVTVGRASGDLNADLNDRTSIAAMYQSVGRVLLAAFAAAALLILFLP